MPTRLSLPIAAILACGSTVLHAQRPQGQPVQLPEGNGKALVEASCSECHSLSTITRSDGYTRDGWNQLFSSMVTLPDPDAAIIAEYLAQNFPERDVVAAVLIPGPVRVDFKEWILPTLGSRPHDPLAAPDGSIWWTGQWSNVLGRLDPKTGAMKEFPLATPKSGPHGLTADQAGNIWFTANGLRYVGKLDPNTGKVTEYQLPEGRGPHTPVFDHKGTLWFTVASGMVGRLDPTTGAMKVVHPPSSPTYPYGIVIDSKGVPWYADFRGNRIGRVDPATMEIREYPLPDAAARPRRITVTPDDMLWYTDYARGYLGRLDPNTGAITEWPSPSGTESRPYGIAAIGTIIWYSESGVRPNTLVRFDTETQTFQTWKIPAGGGVVRNMMRTAEGNLVLAESGVNRVALVEIQRRR